MSPTVIDFAYGTIRIDLTQGKTHVYRPGDKVSGRVWFEPQRQEKIKSIEISFYGRCYVEIYNPRERRLLQRVPKSEEVTLFCAAKTLIRTDVIRTTSFWPFEFQFPEYTDPLPDWFNTKQRYGALFAGGVHPLPPSFKTDEEETDNFGCISYELIAHAEGYRKHRNYRDNCQLRLKLKDPVETALPPSALGPHILKPLHTQLHQLDTEPHMLKKLWRFCICKQKDHGPRVDITPTVFVPHVVIPGREISPLFSLAPKSKPVSPRQPELELEWLDIKIVSNTWIRTRSRSSRKALCGEIVEPTVVVSRLWRKRTGAATATCLNYPALYYQRSMGRTNPIQRCRDFLLIRRYKDEKSEDPPDTVYLNPNPLPVDDTRFALTNAITLDDNPHSVSDFRSFLVARDHELQIRAWLRCGSQRFKLQCNTPLTILPKEEPPEQNISTSSIALSDGPLSGGPRSHSHSHSHPYFHSNAPTIDLSSDPSSAIISSSTATFTTATGSFATTPVHEESSSVSSLGSSSCPTCRHADAESAARILLLRMPPITEFSLESIVEALSRSQSSESEEWKRQREERERNGGGVEGIREEDEEDEDGDEAEERSGRGKEKMEDLGLAERGRRALRKSRSAA
ncbi:uncharacterized protein K452DRAFT_355827 [Aplosporella prunicola CBS 121167]|uniref:Arrestin-like N-terminal domain-containing protein n=1 Tax=Aplosporella prunicola CBS 121167 TaxID=1176127 RepID=A0A6A6BQ31_9PEZI|nr:uncharacterized protein K452DRAFT_355827 [Aplosporella prunicola CBS 121167]KAF2145344.1 hypothetical protein K452DRAFT_355827 [Aplosporella prunicola CBS 121167]